MLKRRPLPIALLFAAALLTAACGNRLVRGESPFVTVDSVSAAGTALELRLRVRNVNEVPIDVRRVRFVLKLEETPLARFEGPSRASVIANGVETLSFELTASDAGRGMLESLTAGGVANLRYDLEGEIQAVEGEILDFTGEGRIYPVPGRPGQFR